MNKILDFFKKDAILLREYKRAANQYGEALSYSYVGEVIGLADLERRFLHWQQKLIQHGYNAPTIEEVVAYGGYGHDLNIKKMET